MMHFDLPLGEYNVKDFIKASVASLGSRNGGYIRWTVAGTTYDTPITETLVATLYAMAVASEKILERKG